MNTHAPGKAAAASLKGRHRQQAILDAAESLLASAGYAGFSMRKVAEHLGMRLSNVQYYFGTTAAVIEALCSRTLEDARHVLESELASDLDSLLRYVLDQQHDRHRCRLYRELWALSARDADIARIVDRFYAAYRDAIAQRIAATLPPRAAARRQRRALLIMSLLEGLSLFRGLAADSTGRQAAVDRDAIAAVHAIAAQD